MKSENTPASIWSDQQYFMIPLSAKFGWITLKIENSVPRLSVSWGFGLLSIKVAEPYVKNLKSYLKIVYRSDSFKISSSSIILLLPTAVFMCTVATRDQKWSTELRKKVYPPTVLKFALSTPNNEEVTAFLQFGVREPKSKVLRFRG